MTDWSQFVAYECRNPECQENCINPRDATCARERECRSCHGIPSLDSEESKTCRPQEATASEPTGAPARPGAQPSEHPGPERERQSRSAPTRQAGSDPSRVDPEGRAHPPNPEGDGGNDDGVTRSTDSTAQPR